MSDEQELAFAFLLLITYHLSLRSDSQPCNRRLVLFGVGIG
jgi:hypothetical protein